MVVPDSFGAWESALNSRYCDQAELCNELEERLLALFKKLETEELTDEEDRMIDLLQDAIAANTLVRLDMGYHFEKIDLGRGKK